MRKCLLIYKDYICFILFRKKQKLFPFSLLFIIQFLFSNKSTMFHLSLVTTCEGSFLISDYSFLFYDITKYAILCICLTIIVSNKFGEF